MAVKDDAQELTAEEKRAKVQEKTERPVLPVFAIEPFAKGQKVTLFELKRATQVAIPNANIAVRALNKQHVEALMVAYQKNEKIPPLELLNTTHGIVIIAGNHRAQAMRDAIAQQMGYNNESELSSVKESLPEFIERLKHTHVPYVPANTDKLKDLEDLNDRIFLNNLTHGLPPSGENRSRYAIYLIARAQRRGEKLTQQQAADIVHVSRVAVARQVMRDTAKAEGTTVEAKAAARKQILPADYVAEEEAQDAMEIAEEQIESRKKSIDPLLDATLTLFRAMQTVNNEVTKGKLTPDELTSYMADIAGTKLTGFKIDGYAFECLTQAIATMFKK